MVVVQHKHLGMTKTLAGIHGLLYQQCVHCTTISLKMGFSALLLNVYSVLHLS